MSARGDGNRVLLVSLLVAVVLTLIPLPERVGELRPYWLALVLIYWNLEAGRLRALGQAFGLGLLLDLMTASLLGQHALSLLIISYLVEHFRNRLRFFPLGNRRRRSWRCCSTTASFSSG